MSSPARCGPAVPDSGLADIVVRRLTRAFPEAADSERAVGDSRLHEERHALPRDSHPSGAGPGPGPYSRYRTTGRSGLHRDRRAPPGVARARVPVRCRRPPAPSQRPPFAGFPSRPAPSRDHGPAVGHRRRARRPWGRTARRGRSGAESREGPVGRGRRPLDRPHRADPPTPVPGADRHRPAVRILPAPRRSHLSARRSAGACAPTPGRTPRPSATSSTVPGTAARRSPYVRPSRTSAEARPKSVRRGPAAPP